MKEQQILSAENHYASLDAYLTQNDERTVFLVCGNSIHRLAGLDQYFRTLQERTGIRVVRFSDFQPNPLYESAVEGVEQFLASGSRTIAAVGGGSAMDVAKCIKLYSGMDPAVNYLEQQPASNDVRLIAIPTTAGTGSEATRFAVIYYKGAKQSVTDDSIVPSAVLFEPESLASLPDYQKKATLMDAMSHAIESYWSIHSTPESQRFARNAIRLILANKDSYLAGDSAVNHFMMEAAYNAGKAINITQTTAGHAMCYKITGLYHTAHGQAAAMVNRRLWPWMVRHTDRCIDPRGQAFLEQTLTELAACMGAGSMEEGPEKFQELYESLQLPMPGPVSGADYEILKTSVNPVRLRNHPIALDPDTIDLLYHEILRK